MCKQSAESSSQAHGRMLVAAQRSTMRLRTLVTARQANRSFHHVPVMAEEVLQQLGKAFAPPDKQEPVNSKGWLVDCTVGGGGHACLMWEHLQPRGGSGLIGFDRDGEAIAASAAAFQRRFGITPTVLPPHALAFPGSFAVQDPVILIHDTYANVADWLLFLHRSLPDHARCDSVAGVLLDAGVSSHQLDSPGRGFTSRPEGCSLDMRFFSELPEAALHCIPAPLATFSPGPAGSRAEYNLDGGVTASQVLAQTTPLLLTESLMRHADFRQREAAAIAGLLLEGPATSSGELSRQLYEAVLEGRVPGPPTPKRAGRVAARALQVLRIMVNDEAAHLARGLAHLPHLLRPGGVAVALTFHSGEARAVQDAWSPLTKPKRTAPWAWAASKQGTRASPEEVAVNSRAAPTQLFSLQRDWGR